MHLSVVGRLEVGVPAGAPLDGRRLEHHVVRPDHLPALRRVDHLGLVLLEAAVRGLGAGGEARVGPSRLVELAPVRVLDRERDDLEADDVAARVSDGLVLGEGEVAAVDGVVLDPEAQVVVQHVQVRLLLGGALRLELGTDGVPEVVVLLRLAHVVVPRDRRHLRDRQVIQPHVHAVLQDRKVLELLHLLRGVLLAAERLAVLVHLHPRIESGGVSLLTRQRLPEILREILDLARLAEWQLIVIELKRCLCADQRLHFHVDSFTILEGARGNTGEVETLSLSKHRDEDEESVTRHPQGR
mmetsp:Transcript_16458/g.39317  ORF Transcript_16458/g.39317 Transcript_16458/m.39317 type:complete len:299 (+) Transcript_16458:1182-2078(+)